MEGRLDPCRRRLTTRGPLGRLQFANQERRAGYPQPVGKQLCPRARTRHMQTRGLPACPRHPNTVTPLSSRCPEEAGTRSTPGSQDSSRCTSAKMRMAHGGGARGCPHKPERAGPRLAHRQPAARTPSGAVRGRAGAGPPVPHRLGSPAPPLPAPRPRASQTPRSPPRAARLAPTPPRTARAPSAASSTDGQGGAGRGGAGLAEGAGRAWWRRPRLVSGCLVAAPALGVEAAGRPAVVAYFTLAGAPPLLSPVLCALICMGFWLFY